MFNFYSKMGSLLVLLNYIQVYVRVILIEFHLDWKLLLAMIYVPWTVSAIPWPFQDYAVGDFILKKRKSMWKQVPFSSELYQALTPFSSLLLHLVTQSCLTLCNSMDCSPPGSSCPWVFRQGHQSGLPFSSFRLSSQLGDQNCISCVSCIGRQILYRQHHGLGFDPWVGKIPWKRAWQPTIVSLPGEPHGQRSLGGYSPWGLKQLSD